MKQSPKEKAKEIVEKYMFKVLNYDGSGQNSYKGKQCALIAVDEILDIDCKSMNEEDFDNHIEYWQEVKQELVNLK